MLAYDFSVKKMVEVQDPVITVHKNPRNHKNVRILTGISAVSGKRVSRILPQE